MLSGATCRQVALGAALIARQFGVQIAADRIESEFEAGELKSAKALAVFFAKHGISVRVRSARPRDLEKRSYLFPCVGLMRGGRALVLAGFTHDAETGDAQILAVNPFDPSAKSTTLNAEEFERDWVGRIVLVTRLSGEESKDRPFDWLWFVPELARFKWLLLLALAISLIVNALAFTPIIFIQIALDKIIGYQATSTLTVLTAAVVLALFFNGVLGYARDYILRFIAASIEARLAGDVFDKLLSLPAQTFQGAEANDLEGGVTGVTTVRSFLMRQVLGGIFDLSAVVVFLPILFAYSGPLALLVVGFAVVMGVLSLFFKMNERDRARDVNRADHNRNLVLRDTIGGIDTVKSLSQETAQRREWRHRAALSIRVQTRRERISILSNQVNSVLQQLMTVAIIFTGIQLVFAGSMSAGALIAVNMVGTRLVRPLVQAISGIADFERVRVAATQIGQVWNAKPERQGVGGQHVVRGAYELTDVVVRFGTVRALDHLTLSIPARGKVAIVGPSAGGKTTLLRLLQGLERPSEGSLEVDGRSLVATDLENFRHQVALVNSQPSFFVGTVEENLRRAKLNVSERELEDALNVSGFVNVLPNLADGLATNINNSAATLPSTYRQLLAFARALVSDPKVLLLDEVFSNLDKEAQLHLSLHMDRLAADRTLVLVSQELRFVSKFDKIVVLEDGKMMGQGTHTELLAGCTIYQRLWSIEEQLLGLGADAP
jgi:ATP-binding cassette subfamily B protein